MTRSTMQLIVRWSLGFLAAMLLVATGCDSNSMDRDETNTEPVIQETVLSADLLQLAVQGALRETTVRLNNYGDEDEEREHSWYRSTDSYVRIGPSLGGGTYRFDIPESRTNVGPFRLLYYVQDLNVRSDSITVHVAPDSLDLTLNIRLPFEEEGTEFKGHCLSETFGRVGGCLGSKDRIAPDAEFEEAGLWIVAQPVLEAGSLSFEATAVQVEGTIQAGSVCDINLGLVAFDMCDALGNYEDDLQAELEQLVIQQVNDPAIRAEIASGLRPFLHGLGIGDVVYVERAGADLVIGHGPQATDVR